MPYKNKSDLYAAQQRYRLRKKAELENLKRQVDELKKRLGEQDETES